MSHFGTAFFQLILGRYFFVGDKKIYLQINGKLSVDLPKGSSFKKRIRIIAHDICSFILLVSIFLQNFTQKISFDIWELGPGQEKWAHAKQNKCTVFTEFPVQLKILLGKPHNLDFLLVKNARIYGTSKIPTFNDF